MPDDPAAPAALTIMEEILPIVTRARAAGWEINMAIEWRGGERFTVSGELKAPPADG